MALDIKKNVYLRFLTVKPVDYPCHYIQFRDAMIEDAKWNLKQQ